MTRPSFWASQGTGYLGKARSGMFRTGAFDSGSPTFAFSQWPQWWRVETSTAVKNGFKLPTRNDKTWQMTHDMHAVHVATPQQDY